MHDRYSLFRYSASAFSRRFILPAYWLSGMCIGVCLSFSQDSNSASLMYRVLCAPVSFVGLATSVFLPIVLSMLAVSLQRAFLFRVLAMIYAIAHSYCATALVLYYRSGAWLLCLLLLFGHLINHVFLFWFWLRYQDGFHSGAAYDCCLGVLCGCFCVLVEYFFFTPVLQAII